jgi:hypothetical protein
MRLLSVEMELIERVAQVTGTKKNPGRVQHMCPWSVEVRPCRRRSLHSR